MERIMQKRREDEKGISSKKPPDEVLDVELNEGFTFRYLIECLALTSSSGTFVFTKNGITYVNRDSHNTVIKHVIIPMGTTNRYMYYSDEDSIRITISLGRLKDVLKTVIKKDRIRLYRLKDDNRLIIQHYSGANDSGDFQFVMTLNEDPHERFKPPEYRFSETFPSYVVPVDDLTKKFSTITRSTSEERIRIYDINGSLVIGTKERNDFSGSHVTIIKQHNQTPILKTPQTYVLTKATAKALSKLQSVYKGPVRIYSEDGLPLKICCGIGSYGHLRIYIKNITYESSGLEDKDHEEFGVIQSKLSSINDEESKCEIYDQEILDTSEYTNDEVQYEEGYQNEQYKEGYQNEQYKEGYQNEQYEEEYQNEQYEEEYQNEQYEEEYQNEQYEEESAERITTQCSVNVSSQRVAHIKTNLSCVEKFDVKNKLIKLKILPKS